MRLRGALGLFNNEETAPQVANSIGSKLKIDSIEGLKDKLYNLEQVLGGAKNGKSHIMKAEEEIISLNRQIINLEDNLRKAGLEKEQVEEGKSQVHEELKSLARTHEDLKAKSMELISRTTRAESENSGLREEKTKLIENILALQRNH